MKQKSPLSIIAKDKKLTNHSARKTTVRRLRESGFQKGEIKNVTGHSSEKGLDPYDSGDDNELCRMSRAISCNANSNSASGKSLTTLQPIIPYAAPQLPKTVTSTNLNNVRPVICAVPKPLTGNFSFGIDFNQMLNGHKSSQTAYGTSSGNVYNNCVFNINTVEPCKPKKRRLVIYSDSEDSQN